MSKFKKVLIRYKNYTLEAYLSFNNGYVIEADAYDDNDSLQFTGKTKIEVVDKLNKWFQNEIDLGRAPDLDRKGFIIYVKAPSILVTLRDSKIGFHVTRKENRDSILKNGLIPNGREDLDTRRASQVLDSLRPSWIPNWVRRQDAVYLYPEFANEHLWSKDRMNIDLFAIKCSSNKIWLGSQSIGGMCLFDEDFDDNDIERHVNKIKTDYGIEYWKNTCSLEQYQRLSSHYKKKHKQAYIDEALYFGEMSLSEIELIGSWDEAGKFQPEKCFENYLTPFTKKNYNEILNLL